MIIGECFYIFRYINNLEKCVIYQSLDFSNFSHRGVIFVFLRGGAGSIAMKTGNQLIRQGSIFNVLFKPEF